MIKLDSDQHDIGGTSWQPTNFLSLTLLSFELPHPKLPSVPRATTSSPLDTLPVVAISLRKKGASLGLECLMCFKTVRE
jgi:hypothetical protein